MQGPVPAPTNVRMTCVIDYQPDVCKDYKETGYCGYGDSCKFLHDRGDYKSGWQLEKDWQESQRAAPSAQESDPSEDEEPFACFICRGPFQMAVETKCKHYFCESCALKNYRKNTKCYVCGAQTNGVFMPVKKLREKAQKNDN
eukprot:Sdes_comp20463_c0_seq4m14713